MLHQRIKDLYLATFARLSRISFWWLRLVGSRPTRRPLWLNLGCGTKYMPGFVNVDVNIFRKKDLWLDMSKGLPWRDRTVDGIYCSNVVEHFYPDEVFVVLSDCRRVLRDGAGARFLVPSLEAAVRAYLARDASWFPDFPRAYGSLGGRFCNFLLCDGQHKLVVDKGFFEELLVSAGFSRIETMRPGVSKVFPLHLLESFESQNARTLVVEAWK